MTIVDTDKPFEILLVEDQTRHQKVYEAAITESLPARVTFATSGEAALQALQGEQPADLVILDLELSSTGGLGGEAVLQKIRADHRLRYIPVIILTGLSSLDKQMELLDLGADDFIEKGGPPSVLIARLKAQLRHKLAIDRLERMALDRDLFAAGVLQDIGSSKWTIVSLCRQAKEALRRDPVAGKPEILDSLAKLSSHASKLGAYAADVIQSVRDTQRVPVVNAQDVGKLLDWTAEVLSTGEDAARPMTWTADGALAPVLADKSFLRLALLNVAQQALRQTDAEQPLTLTVAQEEHDDPQDPRGRRWLLTRIRDQGRSLTGRELTQVFQPFLRGDGGESSSLGLALVGKVMARMGGRVWAETPQDGGPGTVMCLDLPKA